MRRASVDASQASQDPNVTAVLEDSSTSRRAAAHVSIATQYGPTNGVCLHPEKIKAHKGCVSSIHVPQGRPQGYAKSCSYIKAQNQHMRLHF